MAEYKDREHFIPVRRSELIDLLCHELPAEDADRFRRFCRVVTAVFHFEYNETLEQLKEDYAPFDPDRDTRPLVPLAADERQKRLNDLYSDFAALLDRANFTHLSRDDLLPSVRTASDWGVRMDVDFSVFEHLAVFARGDTQQKRTRRRFRNFYKEESTLVDVYQRLVLILKLRKSPRLISTVDTQSVYLKVFKDIPKLDLGMLLPGAQVLMTILDRSKVGVPILGSLGVAAYKVGSTVLSMADEIVMAVGSGGNPLILWGLASGAFGYGYKSYYGLQQTRQKYQLTLTQSLYYQNLDSNAGVLFRLLDEAEEQETREAVLGYFFLWRHAGPAGMTAAALDDAIELYLEKLAGLTVDFEIRDALGKLAHMGILVREGDSYRALPIGPALTRLDQTWDNYFHYNK